MDFIMRTDKPRNQHVNRYTVGGAFQGIDTTPPPEREPDIIPEPKNFTLAAALPIVEPEPVVEEDKPLPIVIALQPPKRPSKIQKVVKEETSNE